MLLKRAVLWGYRCAILQLFSVLCNVWVTLSRVRCAVKTLSLILRTKSVGVAILFKRCSAIKVSKHFYFLKLLVFSIETSNAHSDVKVFFSSVAFIQVLFSQFVELLFYSIQVFTSNLSSFFSTDWQLQKLWILWQNKHDRVLQNVCFCFIHIYEFAPDLDPTDLWRAYPSSKCCQKTTITEQKLQSNYFK